MTHKVVIDAFETKEDAIEFLVWLKQSLGSVMLTTTRGPVALVFDGIDWDSSTEDITVANIDSFEYDYEYGEDA